MKRLLNYTTILLAILISASAQAQYDLSKYKLIFNGKEIKLAQMDSLSKIYPNVNLVQDYSTTPPTLYIKPVTIDSNIANKKRDSIIVARINKDLPYFITKDIKNKKISSGSFKGKVMVLNFYFTSCAPCIKEMPELNILVDEYKDQNVVFIAFALQGKLELIPFLVKHPFKYIQVPDAKAISADAFKISLWPTHMIIDTNGKVQYFSQGYNKNTIGELKQKITDLIR